jgi:hypothetical protein
MKVDVDEPWKKNFEMKGIIGLRIKSLSKGIGSLVNAMKWFIGLLVGSFVAFFFYAIQNNIIK